MRFKKGQFVMLSCIGLFKVTVGFDTRKLTKEFRKQDSGKIYEAKTNTYIRDRYVLFLVKKKLIDEIKCSEYWIDSYGDIMK